MRFWYSLCLFILLFVCTSCCADFAREKWSNLSEEKLLFVFFFKTIHFQHQQGWGSQKYFRCLDLFTCKFIQKDFFNSSPKLFSLNFECYFSLSIKKCLPLWIRPLQTMSFLFNPLYQGNRRHSWSWVWVLILGKGKYKHT